MEMPQNYEAFILGSLLIVMIFSLVAIANYIFLGIGLYKLAGNEGLKHRWLAWVPIANTFLMMMLVENDVTKSLRGKFTLTYGLLIIISPILGSFFLPFSFLPTLLVYYAFFLISEKYSERYVLHFIISIVTLGFSMPFQFFWFRNRTDSTGKNGVIVLAN